MSSTNAPDPTVKEQEWLDEKKQSLSRAIQMAKEAAANGKLKDVPLSDEQRQERIAPEND